MPMPKATVATMRSTRSLRNASWCAARSVVRQPGVIGQRRLARVREPRRQRVDLVPRRAVDDARLALVPLDHVEELLLERRRAAARGRPGWGGRTSRPARSGRAAPAATRCRGAPARWRWRCRRAPTTPGRRSRSRASCRYSGRKSWPHWLMQCASSTATKRTPHAARRRQEAVAAFADEALGRDVEQAEAPLREPAHHVGLVVRRERAVVERRRHAVADQRVHLVLHQRDERRHHHRQARVGERPPAPGSRATCRRRSAARRSSRARRGRPPSPRAAADGTRCNPSSGKGRLRAKAARPTVYAGRAALDILDPMRTRAAVVVAVLVGVAISVRGRPGRRCVRSTTWARPAWCSCWSGCRRRPACSTPAPIPTTRTRLSRPHGARRSRARRLPVAQSRRGRPEHHRHRALRRARRDPHRGAAAGAAPRRRRTVLHAILRLRLLEDARRGGGQVGRAGAARRHGARHPHVPPARHLRALLRHAAGRPRPASDGRLPDAARVQGRRRPGAVSRAARAKGCARGRRRSSIAARRSGPIPRTRRPQTCRPASSTRRWDAPTPRSRPKGAASTSRRRWAASSRWGRRPRACILLSPAPAAAAARERSMFDGIDVSLPGLAATRRPARRIAAQRAGRHRDGARGRCSPRISRSIRRASCRRWPTVCRRPAPRGARSQTLDAGRGTPRPTPTSCSRAKERDFADALVRAAGVVVDPLSDAETVTPGGAVNVSARTFLAYPGIVTITGTVAACARGLASGAGAAAGRREQSGVRTAAARADRRKRAIAVTVPADAAAHAAVLPARARRGDMYQWPVGGERTCRSTRRCSPSRCPPRSAASRSRDRAPGRSTGWATACAASCDATSTWCPR